MSAAAFIATALGPWFGTSGIDPGRPPQPFTERVTLPGNIPADAQAVWGGWMYGYTQKDDVVIEGNRTQLGVSLMLDLKEDGTYRMHYSARWGDSFTWGLNVSEVGKYSLSGEVLLLEPQQTEHADIENSRIVKPQTIDNENHVWIVRVEGKSRLHVAGRCAKYQVDPACKASPNVWFTMKGELKLRRIFR